MKVTRVEFSNKLKKLPDLRRDPETGKYVGWRVDLRDLCGKRRRPVFATKTEADVFAARVVNARTEKTAGLTPAPITNRKITVSQLLEKRKALIKNNSEKIRAERVFRVFQSLNPDLVYIADLRRAHTQIYLNKRIEDGVKLSTIRRELNILSTPIHKAAEMFPIELEGYEPPSIARPSVPKKRRARHEITEAEMLGIVDAILNGATPREREQSRISRPDVAKAFEVAWYLGLRLSENTGLKKSFFKRSAKALLVDRNKTGDLDRLDFIPDRVIEILESSTSETEYFFNIICSETTLRKIIKNACRSIGLTYGRDEIDGVTFSATRRSFTSRLTRETDIATAMAYTGNSREVMIDHYTQASDESKRTAMQRMYKKGDLMQEIYDNVRSGKMSFEAFIEALK